jgi:glycosidase
LYRELLGLRRDHQALRSGSMHIVDPDGALMRFERRGDDEAITVLVNFSDEAHRWPGDVGEIDVLFSTAGDRRTRDALQPNEAVVLRAPADGTQIRSK